MLDPEKCGHASTRRLAEEGTALCRRRCEDCGEMVDIAGLAVVTVAEAEAADDSWHQQSYDAGFEDGAVQALEAAAAAIGQVEVTP